MSALLTVEGLVVDYGRGPDATHAVDGVGFELHEGETLALVGASGSGKSTTAHAIIGLLPEGAKVVGGRISVAGNEILTLRERERARLRGSVIGLVPQDPTVSLDPVQTIGRQIVEAIRLHQGLPRHAARAEALAVLERVGIDRPKLRLSQYPHELSGGQRQRVLIGIATVNGPRLVIADEATSGLDVTVQRRVLDQLDALTAEDGAAVLLITHDLGVAADRADAVVVLENGRVVESGPTARVLGDPQHPATRRLIESAPSLASARDRPSRVIAAEGTDASPLLTVEGLRKEFTLRGAIGRGEHIVAVDDVGFEIPRGQTYALVGESGSGKTTTGRIVAGFERPSGGSARIDGELITGARGAALRGLRRRVQYVYQNPFASLDPRFAVHEIVAEPLRSFGIGTRAERRERALELLEAVHLPPALATRRPAQLSGGQRQRVAIARAIALEPQLVVLDEAVSALDVLVQRQVLELLAELQERLSVSYLFISHDLAVVRLVADEVGVLRAGRLVEHGPVDRVFDDPRHPYTRELLEAIPGTAAR